MENSHGKDVKPPRSSTTEGTAVARIVASIATSPTLSMTASSTGPRSLRRPTAERGTRVVWVLTPGQPPSPAEDSVPLPSFARWTGMRRTLACLLVLATGLLALPAHADPSGPSDPAYQARDAQNIADAYGRITGPNGQLQNPAYLPALVQASTEKNVAQLLQQAAAPNRLAITPGNVFPGWNVGNPLRAGWEGTRGRSHKVAFTNRYGALLRGHVWAPLRNARDPYTGARLRPPYPGVVLTEGSVQGSEGMYEWLAQDLAERGYVVLTYDVQGQGTSETLPHQDSPADTNALPFCNPFAAPGDGETTGCPGVPSQQLSNFVVGTRNALSFFTSTPRHHYPNRAADGADVSAYNPYWRLFDRSPDRRTVTPGRTTRIAIIGHSMGAAAVSKVQGTDDRVEAVVALDKLTGPDASGPLDGNGNKPVVPALGMQSEYGFTVSPYLTSGGSSLKIGRASCRERV